MSKQASSNRSPSVAQSTSRCDGPRQGCNSVRPTRYQIVVRGHLAPHRLRHFEAWTVHQESREETVLEGFVPDQAALYGLLSWLQDLGVHLILVQEFERD